MFAGDPARPQTTGAVLLFELVHQECVHFCSTSQYRPSPVFRTGGKPSTWLPPGGCRAEHLNAQPKTKTKATTEQHARRHPSVHENRRPALSVRGFHKQMLPPARCFCFFFSLLPQLWALLFFLMLLLLLLLAAFFCACFSYSCSSLVLPQSIG